MILLKSRKACGVGWRIITANETESERANTRVFRGTAIPGR
jgi:hypothetical protein